MLVKLLETDTSGPIADVPPATHAAESVFPALDIVRRAGPPAERRTEIFQCVSNHLGSRVWHIREIAAHTICTLMLHDVWLQEVLELIRMCQTRTNRAHGVLMAVKFILERRSGLHAIPSIGMCSSSTTVIDHG